MRKAKPSPTKKQFKNTKYNKNNLTTGELGCLLSHIYILEDAINNNYENILIFEDDVIFHKNFLNKFYKNYKYLIQNEKKFDIIYLGASQKHNWNNVIIKKKYMIANRLDGTFAMIINKNIFNKILYQAKYHNIPNILVRNIIVLSIFLDKYFKYNYIK